jgi:hypothetical protein
VVIGPLPICIQIFTDIQVAVDTADC